MPRETWVWDREAHKLVPAAEYYSRPHLDTRSALGRPYVIGDGCEIKSMANGEMYTSKAKYRADLRAMGFTEVGNDRSFQPENVQRRDPTADLPPAELDVKRAIEEVSSR
jgi:hypothetical protein